MRAILLTLALLTGCTTHKPAPRMVGVENAQAANAGVATHLTNAKTANTDATNATTRARNANNGIQVSLDNIDALVDALLRGEFSE